MATTGRTSSTANTPAAQADSPPAAAGEDLLSYSEILEEGLALLLTEVERSDEAADRLLRCVGRLGAALYGTLRR